MKETIDRTISSVLLQSGDFEIYYHVQDGNSTDGTIELLKAWDVRVKQNQLPTLCKKIHFSYYSEPDNGMYDAIVKGFQKFQIEQDDWMTWINADDIILPSAFALISEIDKQFTTPKISWVNGTTSHSNSSNLKIVNNDNPVNAEIIKHGLCDGKHWRFIQQEGTFFRHHLWNLANSIIDLTALKYASDWNLWRACANFADLYQVSYPLGVFTKREGQITSKLLDKYYEEIYSVIPLMTMESAFKKLFMQRQSRLTVDYSNVDRKLVINKKNIENKTINYWRNKQSKKIITIVTIVLNDAFGIKRTIESVRQQSLESVEYIIIDGSSTDGTVSIINHNKDIIDVFVSESDSGIYNAMNKGIKKASGKYIIFMNSGDTFVSPNTIKNAINIMEAHDDIDVFYGDRIYVNLDGKEIYQPAKPINTVLEKMPYCHQASFVKRNVLLANPFNETYKSAADYDQIVTLYRKKYNFLKIDMVICKFLAGGQSEVDIRAYFETIKIQMDNVETIEQLNKSHYLNAFQINLDRFMAKLKKPYKAALLKNINIDYDMVLYPDRFHLETLRSNHTKKQKLRQWLNSFLHSTIKLPKESKCDFLFVRSLVRDDYKVLFHKISSCIDKNKSLLLEDFEDKTTSFNIEASRILLELRPLYYSFSASDELQRQCLYIKLCYYYYIAQKVLSIDSKVIVSFADMQAIENMITQYAKKQGKITVTLQHGLYVDYNNYKTVNTINYLHQPSEYFLAWGKNTRQLIEKYNPYTKIFICGKPDITCSQHSYHRNQPNFSNRIKNINLKNYLTIILDQKIFNEQNIEMLKIVNEFCVGKDLVINLKFHPQINKEEYKRFNIEFTEGLPLENSKFIVGHTSSLLYELMKLGIKVIKYKSTAPCLETPKEISFSNLDELNLALDREIDYKELAKQYISFFGEDSLDKYRLFFTELLKTQI